ncbi:hypothetical protein K3555_00215 [Leisingera sp. M527]|uniref:hypothetical protein n=1 Tax=Leisingera TaxID=191028 RepID=UPI000427C261|nr:MULTISPECIES: hypothetical protein [Leisingera]MBQ4825705.1 hypothetical protein [Leisingera sp. HS039]MCF6430659.1 hypothetical protein [Leisingera sp. MMG026]QAX27972.1 hypothetical protein ETW24_00210 [Leisingera sp. NJS204]QBR37895.1 hypothetical protein ETW23_19080 [Leisingera sp. NJS201]UWQ28551.1 hypothetical protein K3557_17675 [Leisingera sp. M523]
MFGELEHSCLLKMAVECKQMGLSQSESLTSIIEQTHGFSSPFKIQQVVNTAFNPGLNPDLI